MESGDWRAENSALVASVKQEFFSHIVLQPEFGKSQQQQQNNAFSGGVRSFHSCISASSAEAEGLASVREMRVTLFGIMARRSVQITTR